MLLNIEKAYPEIVKEISVSRFRQDHLSYEFISEAILKDKSVLYIKDYLFMDGSRKYSYHWQNEQGNLIARWDNAAHWPDVSTFPHHVHLGSEEYVIASSVRSLGDVMEAIKKWHCDA